MGNTQILYIGDKLYSFLNNADISIGNINMLDFFPRLRVRFATVTTIRDIVWFANLRTTDKFIDSADEHTVITNPDKNLIPSITEEQTLSEQIRNIMQRNPSIDYKHTAIYNFVANTRYHENLIVSKILEHPLVDPLLGSMMYQNNIFVRKYLYAKDPRINMMRTLRCINTIKPTILPLYLLFGITPISIYQQVLSKRILIKYCLMKMVYVNISIDVFQYAIKNIIHVTLNY